MTQINENGRHDDAAAAGVEMEETTMAEPPLPQSVSTMLCLGPPTEKSPLSDAAATNMPLTTSSSVCGHGPMVGVPVYAVYSCGNKTGVGIRPKLSYPAECHTAAVTGLGPSSCLCDEG